MKSGNQINWRQINNQHVPGKSGIYAWYYDHSLSDFDIQKVIDTLNQMSNTSLKKECVRDYLHEYLFSFYAESPYDAHIAGKLKATYIGQLVHKQDVSDSLVERIVESPFVLYEIKKVLSSITHSFTSPLYIGMAKNLSTRLKRHKALIEKYRTNGVASSVGSNSENDTSDHNFASRVVEKKFTETKLYVVIQTLDEEGSLHNVMENILNRINYPILGRN